MTVYYRAKQPVSAALLVFSKATTFVIVFKNFEFWLYLALHIVLAVLVNEEIVDFGFDPDNFDWNAIGATQFFMTFFVTFYTGDCFRRFLRMYDCCMAIIDSVQALVLEVCVTMPYQEQRDHREAGVKYVLGALYVFFMGLTGGHISRAEWREIKRKGLLTKEEIDLLIGYPPARHIETIHVLVVWSLQVLESGLRLKNTVHSKSMSTSTHLTRMTDEVNKLMEHCDTISTQLGLPVPHQYFHIMNVVLITNLFLFSWAAAFFGTYLTILPVGVSLYFFVGIREISIAVADPLGTDEHDFPVPQFLESAFNTSVGLLETLQSPASHEAQYLLQKHEPFSSSQTRHIIEPAQIYRNGYDSQHRMPFAWSKEIPFQAVNGLLVSPSQLLYHVIRAHDHPDFDSDSDYEDGDEEKDPERESTRKMFQTLRKVNAHIQEKKKIEAAEKTRQEGEEKEKRKPQRKLEHLRRELHRARRENHQYEEEVIQLRASLDVLREKSARLDDLRYKTRKKAGSATQAVATAATPNPLRVAGDIPPVQDAAQAPGNFAFGSFTEVRSIIAQLRENKEEEYTTFGMTLPLDPIREDPAPLKGLRRNSSAEEHLSEAISPRPHRPRRGSVFSSDGGLEM